MSVANTPGRFFNHRYILAGLLTALLLIKSVPAFAEQPVSEAEPPSSADPTIEELHEHSETIAVILETASQRVDELSISNAETPLVLEAIRQEISLSRRWNEHLGTILHDVAEARRALGERERAAAKEIVRMAAAAEEARLELIALRSVLEGVSARPGAVEEEGSKGKLRDGLRDTDEKRIPLDLSLPDAIVEDVTDNGRISELHDARLGLVSMQNAQNAALRDVESVRGKIMEALQTLATARGDTEFEQPLIDDKLTSDDITAWAASMATRLHSSTDRKPE